MKHLLFILISAGWIVGCTTPEEATSSPVYYDLKGFIEKQITELNKRKPAVHKEMTTGESRESKQTADIDWARELELFLQADLNKQAYQQSYIVSQSSPYAHAYALKASENLPVKSLNIVVSEAVKQPELVEAVLQEENKLYESEKKLKLTCTMRPEGVWLIKTYEISGFQHLTLTDKKTFSVKGVIQ